MHEEGEEEVVEASTVLFGVEVCKTHKKNRQIFAQAAVGAQIEKKMYSNTRMT
jgi:hypothetical protein